MESVRFYRGRPVQRTAGNDCAFDSTERPTLVDGESAAEFEVRHRTRGERIPGSRSNGRLFPYRHQVRESRRTRAIRRPHSVGSIGTQISARMAGVRVAVRRRAAGNTSQSRTPASTVATSKRKCQCPVGRQSASTGRGYRTHLTRIQYSQKEDQFSMIGTTRPPLDCGFDERSAPRPAVAHSRAPS